MTKQPRPPRIAVDRTKTATIRMSSELYDRLKTIAEDHGLSLNGFCSRVLLTIAVDAPLRITVSGRYAYLVSGASQEDEGPTAARTERRVLASVDCPQPPGETTDDELVNDEWGL